MFICITTMFMYSSVSFQMDDNHRQLLSSYVDVQRCINYSDYLNKNDIPTLALKWHSMLF